MPGRPEPLTLWLEAGPSQHLPTSSFWKRWPLLVTSTGAMRNSVQGGFAHLTDSDLWERRAQARGRKGLWEQGPRVTVMEGAQQSRG